MLHKITFPQLVHFLSILLSSNSKAELASHSSELITRVLDVYEVAEFPSRLQFIS